MLRSVGSQATLDPLLEVFRAAEPSQFIDDGIIVKRASKKSESGGSYVFIGDDDSPASALVKLDPSLVQIKSKCSPDEFERILLLSIIGPFAKWHDHHPQIYKALVELATTRTIGCFIDTLHYSVMNKEKETKELVKQSLISLGESALPRIRKAIEKPFEYHGTPHLRSVYEGIYRQFQDELDEIQKAIINT